MLLMIISSMGYSQYVTQISTAWDDQLDQWIIFTNDEDVEGTIELKWPLRNNADWWYYELGDLSGDIKKKWDNNANLWEIRSSDGSIITVRTAWTDDFTEWTFTQDHNSYRIRSKYKNIRNEWRVDQGEEEEFLIYMDREGDPRVWIIEDYIQEGTLPLTIGLSFISILHSINF